LTTEYPFIRYIPVTGASAPSRVRWLRDDAGECAGDNPPRMSQPSVNVKQNLKQNGKQILKGRVSTF